MIGRRDPLANPEPLIRRVYAYAAYVLGDGPDAEDVTSETIERALRYRSSYDPRKASPETWLIAIARRCIASRPRPPLLLGNHEPDGTEPGELAAETADRLVVRDAVARLSPRDRELVELRYGADLTAREIGALLDLRTNAVEVALHRVHRRLRAELAGTFARPEVAEAARKGLDAAAGM